MFLKRILIPVDFSIRSRAALRYAAGLARATGAEVEVLHVVAPPGALIMAADAYLGLPLPHPSAETTMWAEDQLDALVSSVDHTGVTVHKRIEAGDPAATIVRIATEEAHDLIVIGTHARTGLANLLLGSIAQTLISCAPCPLVTLRAANG